MVQIIKTPGNRELISPWRNHGEQELIIDLSFLRSFLMTHWKRIALSGVIVGFLSAIISTLIPKTYVSSADVGPIDYTEFQPFLVMTQGLDRVPSREGLFNLFIEKATTPEVKIEFWESHPIFLQETQELNLEPQKRRQILETWAKKISYSTPRDDQGSILGHVLQVKMNSPENAERVLYDWIDFLDSQVMKQTIETLQLAKDQEIASIEQSEMRDLDLLRNKIDQQRKHYSDALEMAKQLGITDANLVRSEPELLEKGPLYLRGTKWIQSELGSLDRKLEDHSYIEASAVRQERKAFLNSMDPSTLSLQSFYFRERPNLPFKSEGFGLLTIMIFGVFLGLIFGSSLFAGKALLNPRD